VHEGLRGTRFDVGWIWPAARVKPRLPDPTVVGGGCCLLRPCTQARCFKQVSYQEAAVLNGRYCKEVRRNEGWVLHCGSAWGRAGTPVWCLAEMVTMLSRPANSVRMSDWRVVSVRTRDRTRGRAGWNPAGGGNAALAGLFRTAPSGPGAATAGLSPRPTSGRVCMAELGACTRDRT